MEINVRHKCHACGGTRFVTVKHGNISGEIICTSCEDGYNYSWVEASDLPILLAIKPPRKKIPH